MRGGMVHGLTINLLIVLLLFLCDWNTPPILKSGTQEKNREKLISRESLERIECSLKEAKVKSKAKALLLSPRVSSPRECSLRCPVKLFQPDRAVLKALANMMVQIGLGPSNELGPSSELGLSPCSAHVHKLGKCNGVLENCKG
ncbi:hypothetical protein CsSME_00030974 [Camellia sinensis var. sinensis]